MRYKIVAVRDRAADVFAQPFFVASIGVAIRSFTDEVNRKDENNGFYKHPEDFDLYLMGEYDDSDGSFECMQPKQICVGKDVRV